jgi:hypothetical protein
MNDADLRHDAATAHADPLGESTGAVRTEKLGPGRCRARRGEV